MGINTYSINTCYADFSINLFHLCMNVCLLVCMCTTCVLVAQGGADGCEFPCVF